jgi:hypothetical protein
MLKLSVYKAAERLQYRFVVIMELPADHMAILEIVGSVPRTMHTLGVLDQKKRMSQLVGGAFDKEEVLSILRALETKGLIKYLSNLDSWKLTEEGRELLD